MIINNGEGGKTVSPRALAFKILKNALSGATYSNIAIDNALKKNELSSFLFLCHFSTKALQHASV